MKTAAGRSTGQSGRNLHNGNGAVPAGLVLISRITNLPDTGEADGLVRRKENFNAEVLRLNLMTFGTGMPGHIGRKPCSRQP